MFNLMTNGAVRRLSDKAIIQADEANRDWQEYQQWLLLGNAPGVDSAAHDSARRPISATPFQFRKALNASGLRAAVDTYIASADQDTKDGYEFATEFRSDDPMVLAAAAAVGKTADEAYDFIALAKTL